MYHYTVSGGEGEARQGPIDPPRGPPSVSVSHITIHPSSFISSRFFFHPPIRLLLPILQSCCHLTACCFLFYSSFSDGDCLQPPIVFFFSFKGRLPLWVAEGKGRRPDRTGQDRTVRLQRRHINEISSLVGLGVSGARHQGWAGVN